MYLFIPFSLLGGVDIQGDCAVTATWNLLEHLVTSKEKATQTVLHRVTVERLFSLGCALPPWLVSGYKKRDCAELIRLYHGQGNLEPATDLALEYLEAVLGQGGEYFGLEHSLQANKRLVSCFHVLLCFKGYIINVFKNHQSLMVLFYPNFIYFPIISTVFYPIHGMNT